MAINALENLVGDMTLSDLSARTGRSVAEIVDYAVRTGRRAHSNGEGGVVRTSNGTTPRATKTAKPTKGRTVNTRTAEGRERYDDAVLEAVRSSRSRIGAAKIRRQVGGTPQQVRTALHRLIERGAIDFEGQARATTYGVT